ncbi:hypothetical protein THAOC_03476 [Thalassiosira oceanica]|uniref:Uncharacterized protein n=1 Tax=Thalassiosira oceanica TaxID=159749 RepID=K0TPS8_THAOC|nr:hypothetical protein THAOC_03476 [Thalassiosira oceanica]|eukprot:EJK74822.1 hypothetical protein THAOC_03476 [Thalassiosira oceanica]
MDISGWISRSSFVSSESASTTTAGSKSGLPLAEQQRLYTEEIIQLKCEIAEQKGRKDELQLDWSRLHSERHDLQTEIVSECNRKEAPVLLLVFILSPNCPELEDECNLIIEQTKETHEKTAEEKQKLQKLQNESHPDWDDIDGVKVTYECVQEELQEAREEMKRVESNGQRLSLQIEDLKKEASGIASDRAKIANECNTTEAEIEELQQEIEKMQQSMKEAELLTNQSKLELARLRKESAKVARRNEILQSRAKK